MIVELWETQGCTNIRKEESGHDIIIKLNVNCHPYNQLQSPEVMSPGKSTVN